MKEKTITLGVAGGIAVYKSCELARQLVKKKINVRVMMTNHAQEFVTPLTFQTLTSNPVATDLFNLTQESEIGHIHLADSDLILVAPATANLIAKAAHGICDDLVTTVLLATKAPVVMAPSMNVNMYNSTITQENISKLKKRGVHFVDPDEGELACGCNGVGRLAEPDRIVQKIMEMI